MFGKAHAFSASSPHHQILNGRNRVFAYILPKLEIYLTLLCKKNPVKIWKFSKVSDPNPSLQRMCIKSLFSLTRFVDWLSPWAQLFFILPFKMSAVYGCTCVVAACLQIFTKHWRALAVFHFESSGAKQMSDSDKTLINILWDGARLEKQFDENPYSLSASQLNILQMRKKFWQTFDPQREVSLQ